MTISQTAPVSSGALWTGRVLSGLIVLFMIFDGVIKLPPLDVVTQTMTQIGWPELVLGDPEPDAGAAEHAALYRMAKLALGDAL